MYAADDMSQSSSPSQQALNEAANWMIAYQDGEIGSEQQQAFERWLEQSEENRFAWQLAEKLSDSMQSLPSGLGQHVLSRKASGRRTLLKSLMALVVMPAGGWWLYSNVASGPQVNNYKTATGERQTFTLEDGSRITLNTGSSVEISYTATSRRVRLDLGEILITTAKDPLQRDFSVETPQGKIRALGTQFAVRSLGSQKTWVSVLTHAVMVQPSLAAHGRRLEAGQQLVFSDSNILNTGANQAADIAWTRSRLIADDMPLADFIRELARYRHGMLRCAPAVAGLKISGVFQLDDTDEVLATVAKTLPVRVFYRSRDWVMVLPAK